MKPSTVDHRSVGAGVHEIKINFGPGYRVYFGIDQRDQFILLGGGHEETPAVRHRGGAREVERL